MANIIFTFSVRVDGLPQAGLTPAWVHLKKLSDNTNATQPAITEVGNGQYKFTYDAEVSGEATGHIDAGVTVINPIERFIDLLLTIERSRIATALPNAAAGANGGLPTGNASGQVSLNLTQDVPVTDLSAKTTQTVGDCLSAGRAGTAGKVVKDDTAKTVTVYGPDDSAVVRTFDIDAATNPKTRS